MWCPYLKYPNIPTHWVEQENCSNSVGQELKLDLRIKEQIFDNLTLMSSFKLFPLKSKCVNELEMLWLRDRECAI